MSPEMRPVRPTDRVSDVLDRSEALVDVFVRQSPHFEKLRNGGMRRVMARLVTVQHAAMLAGVSLETLLSDLNAALEPTGTPAPASGGGAAAEPIGTATVHPPKARVVELDVRDDLRAGREPLSRIMAAVGALNPDEVLLLRAIFQPAPLLTMLCRRGFAHEMRRNAPDDWSIWFWRVSEPHAHAAPATPPSQSAAGNNAPGETWLDVRGLQPPEPLMRTLAALESLPPGRRLVQVNERVPQLLFPMLAERGYACEVDESHADRVLVRIWHPA